MQTRGHQQRLKLRTDDTRYRITFTCCRSSQRKTDQQRGHWIRWKLQNTAQRKEPRNPLATSGKHVIAVPMNGRIAVNRGHETTPDYLALDGPAEGRPVERVSIQSTNGNNISRPVDSGK